ncbi:MAG TPA: hypothetical protein VF355_05625 [Anaerolineaceae bacterium]
MNLQLSMFASYPGDEPPRLREILTQPAKDLLEIQGQLFPSVQDVGDWDNVYEGTDALDPFEVLGFDPLLADVSSDATGILSEPDWSAVFATQNLLDQLRLGIADLPEMYEQHLYNVICRARLELDLVGHPERVVPFYYHTDTADLRLALVIRNEFQPPAAIIGLAEDF